VALRVYLNPYVDLELTTEAAREYEAADEPGRRNMASRLLADHIELAGIGEEFDRLRDHRFRPYCELRTAAGIRPPGALGCAR
jgi:hypothetical protein